jgi:translation initiation factor IF-2
VKKCQDEGLNVQNHMATISAGLAATIREWFSEGENVTTVETAERVDLDEVRVKRRPKHAEEGQVAVEPLMEEEEEETDTLVVATEETMAEPVVEAPEELPLETPVVVEEAPPVAAVPAEPEVPLVVVQPEQPPVEVKAPEPVKPPEKLKPPEIVVMPAGPMLDKPRPAKLTGPQIVRVEAPEPPDRPRSRFKPRYDAPVTQPLIYAGRGSGAVRSSSSASSAPSSDAADKKGAKHGKDRTHGRRKEETDEDAIKKAKLHKNWRQRDIEERQARLTAAGGEGLRLRPTRRIASKAAREAALPVRPKTIVVSEPILVKDLAGALAVKVTDVIGKLMKQGIMASANQVIGNDVAELVAVEYDTELVVEKKASLEEKIRKEFDERERPNQKRRPVVAAMLGHVDHGKTSLLDRIRSTHVAAGEAGGITQHIGASQVSWDNKTVTFLDTPGHEAFTAMRARGANMTDIVVLVVAADDGVMPQTIEAIAHSKAAGVPIIVALNKIDLPGIDINRIYSQLSEHGLAPAEWGGPTEVVKTKIGRAHV